MSNSHQFLDSQRSGKAPERSNFVNTCNLLSQYLKEKGGLKDLNREISGKLESIAKSETTHVKTATTKNLLNTIEDLNQPPTEQAKSQDNSSINTEDPTNKAITSKEATMESKSAQMTIFYDGKIWVFDGLLADKAGEVVLFASKGSSHWSGGNLLSSGTDELNPARAVASTSSPPVNSVSTSGKQHVQPLVSSVSTSGKQHVQPPVNSVSTSGKQHVQPPDNSVSTSGKHVQPQPDANGSDLPIARRSSLHRFLEKRKDRATARGPYQVQNTPASSSKNDDQQLELKL